MLERCLLCVCLFVLAACASVATSPGAAGWNRATWLSQAASDYQSGPWRLSAAPLGTDGFKLKLTLQTDLFGTAGADPNARPTTPELEAAARQATPQGCTFVSVTPTEDGGALADYDCAA